LPSSVTTLRTENTPPSLLSREKLRPFWITKKITLVHVASLSQRTLFSLRTFYLPHSTATAVHCFCHTHIFIASQLCTNINKIILNHGSIVPLLFHFNCPSTPSLLQYSRHSICLTPLQLQYTAFAIHTLLLPHNYVPTSIK
jgi:hypothetical protein